MMRVVKFFVLCSMTMAGFSHHAGASVQPWQNSRARQWYESGVKEKNVEKKIAALHKAVEADPLFVEALFALGLAYKERQDFTRAEQYISKAYHVDPDKLSDDFKIAILHELAAAYNRQGKATDYEETLRQIKNLAGDPQRRATIAFELGRFLYQQGRYDEALAVLQEGQRLDPAKQDYFANLIQLTQTAQETRRLYAAIYEQAQKHEAGGELELAIKNYTQLLQIQGGYKDANARVEKLRQMLEQEMLKRETAVQNANVAATLPAHDSTAASDTLEMIAAPSEADFEIADTAWATTSEEIGDAGRINHDLDAPAALASNDQAGVKHLVAAQANPMDEIPVVEAPSNSRNFFYAAGAVMALLVFFVLGLLAFSPVARARLLLFRGRYGAAARIYESALIRQPGRLKLYPPLAHTYLRMGRRDQDAMRIYRMILQFNLASGHRDEINAVVAQKYLTEGRTDDEAVGILEQALKVEKRRPAFGAKTRFSAVWRR
ncbi:MAG: tetratricopeptide repeat protein [candidate division KSB1 bacterium]|nr:tetratricopeptide repeat protein [candidate division KSB1 bacterium]MDZ7369134.1 tetratricopeptide repeat protein [candidate division KSB1 bacterium]MDZ7407103.1 tetratricopeptide repeat protein [candidate division KSB1 bacterium]